MGGGCTGKWLGVLGVVLLTGCWKAPQPAAPPAANAVAILPAEATLTVGHTVALATRVDGRPGWGVAWKVLEPQGGTVDRDGTYRAPATPGRYTVQADFPVAGGRSAVAKLTVLPKPTGKILAPAHVLPGAGNVRAHITPVPGNQYAWTLTGGEITEGSTTPAITFQAGAGPTVVLNCRITNAAGQSSHSSLTLALAAPVTLTIQPAQVTLTAERAMKFGFELTGGATLGVTWSLGEPGAGRLDAAGNYVAPAISGLYTVRVTANDDPTRFATAKVKVVPRPPQDLFAPTSFIAGMAGLQARTLEVAGMTYAWTIEGGTITAGAATSTVTFTAGAGPTLTLRCRISNEAGDSFLAEATLRAQ